jgi:hypothetical protein
MVVYVHPEIQQGGFQRTLCGDVPLVGSERLNETCVDVVIRRTSEEMNSGMFEWPDVHIPGIKTKSLVV